VGEGVHAGCGGSREQPVGKLPRSTLGEIGASSLELAVRKSSIALTTPRASGKLALE